MSMAGPPTPVMPGAYTFSSRPFSAMSLDTAYFSPDDGDDDDEDDEIELEQLRRNIRTNLTLRPIPVSKEAPLEDLDTPLSAAFHYTTAPSTPTSVYSPSVYSPEDDEHPLSPTQLVQRLGASMHPLILDTRPATVFEQLHIADSVNLAIPSLILKRCRKPGGNAFNSLDALRPFITTPQSRASWDTTMDGMRWNGEIVLTADDMHIMPTSIPSSIAWTLLPALAPLAQGRVYYLRGALRAPELGPHLRGNLVAPIDRTTVTTRSCDTDGESILWDYLRDTGSCPPSPQPAVTTTKSTPNIRANTLPTRGNQPKPKKSGLFSLRTDSFPRASRSMPIIDDPPSASLSSAPSSSSIPFASSSTVSPASMPKYEADDQPHPSSFRSSPPSAYFDYDASPSPAPSSSPGSSGSSSGTHFPRPPRRGLTLGIDTKSAERLRSTLSPHAPLSPTVHQSLRHQPPKLHLRPLPSPNRASTLDIPPIPPSPRPGGGWEAGTRLPKSPHRPTLVVTSQNSNTKDFDSLDVPGNDGEAQYLRSPGRNLSVLPRRSVSPDIPSPPHTARPTVQNQDKSSPYFVSGFPLSPSAPTFPSAALQETHSTTSSEEEFTISTILPNFLYLGPEPSLPTHIDRLRGLGVRRILNMAIECDDHGPEAWGFDRYLKIPMRDTVEEVNVRSGMREVCRFLDDARLHSQPTFVHCKAGKSRSATAVLAYLIHANHWPLAQAYAYVLARRGGISPNIGFVSELMGWEEEELGGRSLGVISNPSTTDIEEATSSGSGYTEIDDVSSNAGGMAMVGGAPYGGMAALAAGAPPAATHLPSRRGAHHIRDSLPPFLQAASSSAIVFADGTSTTTDSNTQGSRTSDHHRDIETGDAMALSQEVEVKDAEGRYRHARRAPVDGVTLQPLRRVSKAGLESTEWAWNESQA